MKFLAQEGLLPGTTYLEKFKQARECGLDGVELSFGKPPWLDGRVDDLNKAVDAVGIYPLILCSGYRGWIGDFDETMRQIAISDISKTMSFMPQLGCTGIIAPAAYGMYSNRLPSTKKARTSQEDQDILVDSISRIAEAAEKNSVNFLLEPLNRYEDHMLNTIEQCAVILDKVGSSRCFAMADCFHMSIEEADIAATIKKYAKYIRHIHLADSNRIQPGKGHTDFMSIFEALKEIVYSDTLSYECGFIGDNRIEDIKESLSYLKTNL